MAYHYVIVDIQSDIQGVSGRFVSFGNVANNLDVVTSLKDVIIRNDRRDNFILFDLKIEKETCSGANLVPTFEGRDPGGRIE
ncbi:MAG: hypothetical protein FalmKO_22350 [Falsiruegeria mediterranea]